MQSSTLATGDAGMLQKLDGAYLAACHGLYCTLDKLSQRQPFDTVHQARHDHNNDTSNEPSDLTLHGLWLQCIHSAQHPRRAPLQDTCWLKSCACKVYGLSTEGSLSPCFCSLCWHPTHANVHLDNHCKPTRPCAHWICWWQWISSADLL